MSFKDHFSIGASDYQRFRPHYPSALFADIAALCQQRALVWDVGTGNGQAAVAWTEWFSQIYASDASEAQIAQASAHPKIRYVVGPAESCALADHSVDLVSVAQALHWFDFSRFYAEVNRVLRPGGIVVAWTYTKPESVIPSISAALAHFYTSVVGPYWPPERAWVDQEYQTIPFPFRSLALPHYQIQCDWDLDQLLGYLDTWSASQAYSKTHGSPATEQLRPVLAPLFRAHADPQTGVRIVWRVVVRCGVRCNDQRDIECKV